MEKIKFLSCSDGVLRAHALKVYNRLVVDSQKRSLIKDEILLYNTIRRFYLGVVGLDSVRNAFVCAYGN